MDNDCDGQIDEASALDSLKLYLDDDGDGYGDPDESARSCEALSGYVDAGEDCDDSEAAINPGADEVFAGIDNNCDESIDQEAVDATLFYEDGDGFGGASTAACEAPKGLIEQGGDCDDADEAVHPDAAEVCDSIDNDCDSLIDDDDPTVDTAAGDWWYPDGDGFGEAAGGTQTCSQPSTDWVTNAEDCDDTDAAISPAADEICDGADTDEDCDGAADDADSGVLPSTTSDWYLDDDGDGDGDPDTAAAYCDDPSSGGTTWLSDDTDCDDTDAAVSPGASEICDESDNDCDPTTTASGVSFISGGSVTDLTASFAGTSSSPLSYTASSPGTLAFCQDTFYVNLTVSADVEVTGTDGATLSASGSGPVVTVSGSSTDLTLTDIIVTDGGGERISTTFWGITYTNYYGGGIYSNDTVDMEDTDISSNDANYGAGLYIYGSSLNMTCTGSTSIDAGFLRNAAVYEGGALGQRSWGYTATYTFTDCDFGSSDDNSPEDILISSSSYDYGDDESFTCDIYSGCR